MSKRSKLKRLLASLPAKGAPFPRGGVAGLADRAGCSRQYAHGVLAEDYPDILARHRRYKAPARCGNCGGKA